MKKAEKQRKGAAAAKGFSSPEEGLAKVVSICVRVSLCVKVSVRQCGRVCAVVCVRTHSLPLVRMRRARSPAHTQAPPADRTPPPPARPLPLLTLKASGVRDHERNSRSISWIFRSISWHGHDAPRHPR